MKRLLKDLRRGLCGHVILGVGIDDVSVEAYELSKRLMCFRECMKCGEVFYVCAQISGAAKPSAEEAAKRACADALNSSTRTWACQWWRIL